MSFADRDAILGTIDSSGNFTSGRTAYTTDDGKIKEVESRLQADPSNEHPLDSKIYHLRAQCYGDTLIPLGKFSSGIMTLNWSTWGEYASVSGNMVVASHWGGADISGPFIMTQQEGAAGGRAKLRVAKGVGGDYDGFFLYLEYHNPALGHAQMVSVSISTTQSISETYGESSAATATLVPVYSNVSTLDKRFDFNKDVYINGSKALTEGSAPTSSTWTNAFMPRQMGTSTILSSGGLVAWGNSSQATAAGALAIGPSSYASGTNSTAIGNTAQATGQSSISIGEGSMAFGNNSIVMGEYSMATNVESLALGAYSYSNGLGAVTIGGGESDGDYSFATTFGLATGQLAIAMGGSTATGEGSVALGGYDTTYWPLANYATGENATSLGGISNSSTGFASFSSGNWSRANAAYSIALGSLNKGSGSSATNWVETDSLLELGNGYAPRGSGEPSSTLRSNALTTLKNGQTTLSNKFWNASSPTDIPSNATESSNGQALVVEGHAEIKGNTVLEGKVTLAQPQGDISMGVYGD
ncbi:MAG: hypothetical protein QM755_11110 [Luteolibacter sp.]